MFARSSAPKAGMDSPDAQVRSPEMGAIEPTAPPAGEPAAGDRYRLLFEGSPEALLLIDPVSARVVEANRAARSFYAACAAAGDSAVDPAGRPLWEIAALDRALVLDAIRHALATGQGALLARLAGDDKPRDVEIGLGPVQVGNETLLWSVSRDVTERLAAEEHSRRLGRLAATLSALEPALGAADREDAVLRAGLRVLAEAGGFPVVFVGLGEPATRGLRVVAVDGAEEYLSAGLRAYEGAFRPPSQEIAQTVFPGHTYLHRLTESDQSSDWAMAARIGLAGAALVPMVNGSFTLGMLGLLTVEPDFFGEAEVGMLEAAAAMMTARMSEIEHAERDRGLAAALEAEHQAAERFATSMATLDRSLGRLATPTAVYEQACRLAFDLGICSVSWIGVIEIAAGRQVVRVAASAGDPADVEATGLTRQHRFPVNYESDPSMPVTQTVVVHNLLEDPRFRSRRPVLLAAGFRALAALPLYVGARLAGGMAFYARETGAFDANRLALLERLVANAGARLAVLESESRHRVAEDRATGF
jgi:GAF domain-containing protein